METKKRDNVMVLDPELYMQRLLHYKEKHSGWYIFQAVYIGVYLFVVGFLFLFSDALHYSPVFVAGISLIVLAMMVVVYGFVASLHTKLMKKYG